FRQKHQGNLLRLWPRGEADILAMVATGEADLGVVPTADVPVGFDFAPLFTIGRTLVAPKGHPVSDLPEVTFSTLARWPLVMLGVRSRTRRLLDEAFQRRGISYELAVETDSLEAIKQYVAGGEGISILPDISVSPADAAELEVLSLPNLLPEDVVGVVTLRGRPLSQAAQAFIEELGGLRGTLARAG
ncbi:MAG: LysR family transcriptional regulator substrate-binding protein, partial [Chloroflexota bacterium]|nr:LysR family transcriptional regulator substrate-binding protein [Chloroflexota bacterium]